MNHRLTGSAEVLTGGDNRAGALAIAEDALAAALSMYDKTWEDIPATAPDSSRGRLPVIPIRGSTRYRAVRLATSPSEASSSSRTRGPASTDARAARAWNRVSASC